MKDMPHQASSNVTMGGSFSGDGAWSLMNSFPSIMSLMGWRNRRDMCADMCTDLFAERHVGMCISGIRVGICSDFHVMQRLHLQNNGD